MRLLKTDLFLTETEHSSPGSYPKRSKSLFAPFQKERDSMNRLIKRQPMARSQLNQLQLSGQAENTLQKMKETAMSKKISECFKHQSIFDDCCQPKKRKIVKKTLIQLLTDDSHGKRPSTEHVTRRKIESRPSESSNLNRFSKTHSMQFYKPSEKAEPNIKRISSSIIPRVSNSFSPKKMIQNSPQSPKKVVYYQSKINIQENMDKYPELTRHRRLREMEIKLNQDFEQTHSKFLGKMMESKQLAFEVKNNLNKLDGYC